MYDIIPDIHGDYFKLKKILVSLGYEFNTNGWSHPGGRKAVFLGDFIDGGIDNFIIVNNVKEMVDNGNAFAIMGNHEFNAILYHTRGDTEEYLRPHSDKNTSQHKNFLKELPLGSKEAESVIDWFISLPLFLEFEEFRVVHAFWSYEAIHNIKNICSSHRLTSDLLLNAASEDDMLGISLESILKGPEFELPDDIYITDNKGFKRNVVRLKWWSVFGKTYRDFSTSITRKQKNTLPNVEIDDDLIKNNMYRDSDKPLFFGHYKLEGKPEILQGNVLCLDCPEYCVAYRWNEGDTDIKYDNILVTERK